MRQFDVFRNPSARSRDRAPYLLVLPNRYLLDLQVTIVAPLVRTRLLSPVERLNPVFSINDEELSMSTLELANMPTSALREPVGNFGSDRDRIIAALDFLFTGV